MISRSDCFYRDGWGVGGGREQDEHGNLLCLLAGLIGTESVFGVWLGGKCPGGK